MVNFLNFLTLTLQQKPKSKMSEKSVLLSSVPLLLVSVVLISTISCADSYDFIIVGGGTSGCALARRLVDNRSFNVLLIESGDVPGEDTLIPSNAPNNVANPEVTFRYPSIPQRYAGRRNNGILNFISGRFLGGTSSLNYEWVNRGSPLDYDNWVKIVRDPSWRYENMLKYFKRVETYRGDFPTDQHGYNGPISVSRPRYAPGLDYWLAAGQELGYPVADPNGPQQISFGPVEFSKRNGRRDSSFIGYLKPVLFTHPNLHVLTNTNVTQIIFQGKNAIGVRFQPKSPDFHGIQGPIVYATKEIILSAGVIGSALLLQRSGVGPHDILEAAGIPLVQDLPVGSNLQDHVALPIHLYINNASAVLDETRDLTPANFQYFKRFGDGPYSNTRGGTGQAFAVSSTAASLGEANWPDLHLCMAHSVQPYLSAYLGSNTTSATSPGSSEVLMSASVFLTRPRSRGSVFLNPNDPTGLPILNMGFFEDARDMQSLLDGVKETVRIFERTSSYRRLAARILPADFPGCQNRVFKSDQYWKCYIRYASQVGLHAGGTCRMGNGINDPTAVVDSKLRVLGLAGLRVIDASIMPAQTNANTQAAVYGIAEKGADMILTYWSQRHR